jgi:pimeloyl-ACP methyl ester carboxylesterase
VNWSDKLQSLWHLAYWLGPLASSEDKPDVTSDEMVCADESGERPDLRVRFYRPRRTKCVGSIALIPGVHNLGPDDPRFDRFASILAQAGFFVMTPFLTDFLNLRIVPGILADTQRAFDALWEHPKRPPGKPALLSISFGSLPAIRLACHPDYAAKIGGLLTFGAYAQWQRAFRFCLEGDGPQAPHYPLNYPVIYLNLRDHMPAGHNEERLCEAWFEFIRRTWGRPAMRQDDAWKDVAYALEQGLESEDRRYFLEGCGLMPDSDHKVDKAIEAASHLVWLDPRPYMHHLQTTLVAVHGRQDDVIPYEESQKLVDACPPQIDKRVHTTGLYGHTRVNDGRGWFGQLRTLVAEANTTYKILWDLSSLGKL